MAHLEILKCTNQVSSGGSKSKRHPGQSRERRGALIIGKGTPPAKEAVSWEACRVESGSAHPSMLRGRGLGFGAIMAPGSYLS